MKAFHILDQRDRWEVQNLQRELPICNHVLFCLAMEQREWWQLFVKEDHQIERETKKSVVSLLLRTGNVANGGSCSWRLPMEGQVKITGDFIDTNTEMSLFSSVGAFVDNSVSVSTWFHSNMATLRRSGPPCWRTTCTCWHTRGSRGSPRAWRVLEKPVHFLEHLLLDSVAAYLR